VRTPTSLCLAAQQTSVPPSCVRLRA
jgi:hypothetical protein